MTSGMAILIALDYYLQSNYDKYATVMKLLGILETEKIVLSDKEVECFTDILYRINA